MKNWFTKEWWRRICVWIFALAAATTITFVIAWGLAALVFPPISKTFVQPVPVKIIPPLTT